MNLSDLLKNGEVRAAPPDAQQAKDCLDASQRDIRAARIMLKEDCDWAFTIAYNAMLQGARALMFSEGYFPAGEAHHKAVVDYADAKLGAKNRDLMDLFERMRKKRHHSVYDKAGTISKFEAENAVKTAEEFLALIIEKIKLAR